MWGVHTTRYSVIFQKFLSRVRVVQKNPSLIQVTCTRWTLLMTHDILGTSCGYLGDILGISWRHLGDIFVTSLGHLGHILDIYLAYLGHIWETYWCWCRCWCSRLPCYVFCICLLTYKWISEIQISWVGRSTNADVDAVTPSSNTRSYTLWSVPSSPRR